MGNRCQHCFQSRQEAQQATQPSAQQLAQREQNEAQERQEAQPKQQPSSAQLARQEQERLDEEFARRLARELPGDEDLGRMSSEELRRALPHLFPNQDVVADEIPIEVIEEMFASQGREEEEARLRKFAEEANSGKGVPLSKVRKCWMCGQYTVSPLQVTSPPHLYDCPHIVCRLQCLQEAVPKWIDIASELRDMEPDSDGRLGVDGWHAPLQQLDEDTEEDAGTEENLEEPSADGIEAAPASIQPQYPPRGFLGHAAPAGAEDKASAAAALTPMKAPVLEQHAPTPPKVPQPKKATSPQVEILKPYVAKQFGLMQNAEGFEILKRCENDSLWEVKVDVHGGAEASVRLCIKFPEGCPFKPPIIWQIAPTQDAEESQFINDQGLVWLPCTTTDRWNPRCNLPFILEEFRRLTRHRYAKLRIMPRPPGTAQSFGGSQDKTQPLVGRVVTSQ